MFPVLVYEECPCNVNNECSRLKITSILDMDVMHKELGLAELED